MYSTTVNDEFRDLNIINIRDNQKIYNEIFLNPKNFLWLNNIKFISINGILYLNKIGFLKVENKTIIRLIQLNNCNCFPLFKRSRLFIIYFFNIFKFKAVYLRNLFKNKFFYK